MLSSDDLPPLLGIERDGAPGLEEFGGVLRSARETRLSDDAQPRLSNVRPDSAALDADEIAIPHMLAWGGQRAPALVWERLGRFDMERLLDAGPELAARWASRPESLLRLAELSLAAQSPGLAANGEQHLSFRWVLAHEADVASLLSDADVTLDHVSLHLGVKEAEAIADILIGCVGLIEVERPASIPTPGRWLACGYARIHLSTRERKPGERGFPGTAPNHVCFGVTDLDAVAAALDAAGIATTSAGSLGGQLWVRLSDDTAIEFQRRRR